MKPCLREAHNRTLSLLVTDVNSSVLFASDLMFPKTIEGRYGHCVLFLCHRLLPALQLRYFLLSSLGGHHVSLRSCHSVRGSSASPWCKQWSPGAPPPKWKRVKNTQILVSSCVWWGGESIYVFVLLTLTLVLVVVLAHLQLLGYIQGFSI